MIMKAILVAAAAVLLSAGAASAAPKYNHYHGKPNYSAGKVTPFERVAIARAKLKVALVQRRARADGRVTPYERAQIRQAQSQLSYTIARSRRT
jgi:hypothetical protein